jgi:hypothetical protein
MGAGDLPPDWLWGPPSASHLMGTGVFFVWAKWVGCELIILHLELRLRISGDVLLLTMHVFMLCMETYLPVYDFTEYTGCPRRNVQYFGRVFLMLNYNDITQNTYIQS